MSYSLYEASVPPMVRMLQNLSRILDKAVTEAKIKNIPLSRLVAARLAPDMFAFPRQIELATSSAVALAARLVGDEPPSLPDAGSSFPEFQKRIAAAIAFLQKVPPARYEGAEDRDIAFEGHGGPQEWLGRDYAAIDRLPNFYFHVVTAYALLRHSGIDVGKRDYLGPR